MLDLSGQRHSTPSTGSSPCPGEVTVAAQNGSDGAVSGLAAQFECGTPANPSYSSSGLRSFLTFPEIPQKPSPQPHNSEWRLIILRAAPRANQIPSPGASRHQKWAD